MVALSPSRVAESLRSRDLWERAAAGVAAGTALGVVGLLTTSARPVLVVAAGLALLAIIVAVRAPRTIALCVLAFFLPFAGIVRRFSGSYVAKVDPLNLLGPLVACACLLIALKQGGRRSRTSLSGAVGVLVCLGVAEVFNPLQGSIVVGLVGAVLFIGPLIWFYLGQVLGDSFTLTTLQRWLRGVALVVAIYGVKQLVFGFTGFEDRWITAKLTDYHALNIGGDVRPFSTFSSAAEYSYFLILGALLLVGWRSRLGPARMVLVGGFLLAAFFAGSRSIFVTGSAAVAAVLLVRGPRTLLRALALCIVMAVIGLALLRFIPLAVGDSRADKIRNRTLEGLRDPFNPDVSTLGIHFEALVGGVSAGFSNPIGSGAGLVNAAGQRLGTKSASAENDVPNMIIAYGWAGLVILIVITVRVYRLTRDAVATKRPELLGPAVFALALFGVWFAGQLYVVSSLVWFFLGALDRQMASGEAVDLADAGTAADRPDAGSILA